MGIASKRRIKILITSAGSLVGQNILDVLDYPDFKRRELAEIIGINSIAESACLFRCDKSYLVPETSSESFFESVYGVIVREKPDIIFCGRDTDTVVMSELLTRHPELSATLPYGGVDSLLIALDKHETKKFADKYDLPFAYSHIPCGKLNDPQLSDFIDRVGYPFIAKPQRGSASQGVFFIRDRDDLEYILHFKNYIFQEYLGNPYELEEYFKVTEGAVPLFFHAPNIFHHSCHTIIDRNGATDPVFVSLNEHESGVTLRFRKVNEPELVEITRGFANAIFKEGGYGPMTVQFRRDRNGKWKAQEMNMRTNGNTYPRFLTGQDEIGLIINSFLPDAGFPVYSPAINPDEFIFGKSLRTELIHKRKFNELIESGFTSGAN